VECRKFTVPPAIKGFSVTSVSPTTGTGSGTFTATVVAAASGGTCTSGLKQLISNSDVVIYFGDDNGFLVNPTWNLDY